MSIWLCWILLPFLLLLSISLLLISAVLEVGIVPSRFFSKPWLEFFQNFGFVYGYTHRPSLTEIGSKQNYSSGDRYILNTGS